MGAYKYRSDINLESTIKKQLSPWIKNYTPIFYRCGHSIIIEKPISSLLFFIYNKLLHLR